MKDYIELILQGGNGGPGVVSFRREKYVPLGGPDGGDGGRGGNVYAVADKQISSLRELQRSRTIKAAGGEKGGSGKKRGRDGAHIFLSVPLGTVIWKRGAGEDKALIAELLRDGDKILLLRGGVGGYGNAHFATAMVKVPKLAEVGEAGEEGRFIFEHKLLIDVAIVGSPGSGKSTLLSSVTNARPRVGSYLFTTTEPVLGVYEMMGDAFVVAELPAIVEGASHGLGLGAHFLKHAERCAAIIHLLDGASPTLPEDLKVLREEVGKYNIALLEKPFFIAVNKVDLPEVRDRIGELHGALKVGGAPVFFISAATKENVGRLMESVIKVVSIARKAHRASPSGPSVRPDVLRPVTAKEGVAIQKKGGAFIIVAPRIERLMAGTDFDDPEARAQLEAYLMKAGVRKALEKAGFESGDTVRIGEVEMEWL